MPVSRSQIKFDPTAKLPAARRELFCLFLLGYRQGLEKYAAGIRYNLAKARAEVGDWAGAREAALASLADCSNYQPAAELIGRALRQSEEVSLLGQGWGPDE